MFSQYKQDKMWLSFFQFVTYVLQLGYDYPLRSINGAYGWQERRSWVKKSVVHKCYCSFLFSPEWTLNIQSFSDILLHFSNHILRQVIIYPSAIFLVLRPGDHLPCCLISFPQVSILSVSAFSPFWPSYFIPPPNFILLLFTFFLSPPCLWPEVTFQPTMVCYFESWVEWRIVVVFISYPWLVTPR